MLLDSIDIGQSVLASFFVHVTAAEYDVSRREDLMRLLVRMARHKVASQARRQRARAADQQRVEADNLEATVAGRRALEILEQAKRCELDGALARLDGCGADAELLQLAKVCLAPAPQDRPRDAGAVAERVTAYLASVQERLRQVAAERAAAQARTQAEAKTLAAEKSRRGTALALAAALVLLVAGAAWLMRSTERTVRRDYLNKEVGLALDEAADKRTELHRKFEDPKQVEELLSDIDQWQARLQGA